MKPALLGNIPDNTRFTSIWPAEWGPPTSATTGLLVRKTPGAAVVDWDDFVTHDGKTRYGKRDHITLNLDVLVDDDVQVRHADVYTPPINNTEPKSYELGAAHRHSNAADFPAIENRPARPVAAKPVAGDTVPGWAPTLVQPPSL